MQCSHGSGPPHRISRLFSIEIWAGRLSQFLMHVCWWFLTLWEALLNVGGMFGTLLSWNRLWIACTFPSGHFANFAHCSNSSMIGPHWIMLSCTYCIDITLASISLFSWWPTLMIVLSFSTLPQHTLWSRINHVHKCECINKYAHARDICFHLWTQPQHACMLHVHAHTHHTHTHTHTHTHIIL